MRGIANVGRPIGEAAVIQDRLPQTACQLIGGKKIPADPLRRVLGETGIEVSTRISGILVAAIAVQLIQEGIVELFPSLVS